MGHVGQLRLQPVVQVQVGRTASAPVQGGGACDVFGLHVLDDGFDRGKAGTRGQKHDGLGRFFAQVKAAKGAFNALDLFFFHHTKHVVGELATGHVTDVQFHRASRCIGHRVAAACAVAQQELHILTRVVLEIVVGGQLQLHHHHIVGFFLQADHTHREFTNGESPRLGHLARLQHHIAVGLCAAGQHHAGRFFLSAKSFALVRTMRDRARYFFAFA